MSFNGKALLIFTFTALVTIASLHSARGQEADDEWKGSPQEAFLEGPIVTTYQCVTCHTITDQGGTVGPILNLVGLRRSAEWLDTWLQDPNAVKPGTKMPKFPFQGDERAQTVRYLSNMLRELRTDEILASPASSVEKGRALFADYDCSACHRVGDTGRFVGPDLTWVGIRKPESWERVWLHDPPAFKPDTFMPNFNIPDQAGDHLAAYLHTLQGQENEAGQRWEFMISFMINTTPVFRGEMVWKRLGCWSCHGEEGRGKIANPNAAVGHELVPNMKGARDKFSREELLGWITTGSSVPAADPDGAIEPYACPSYDDDVVNEQGLNDLYAYISSLAPAKSRWTIK